MLPYFTYPYGCEGHKRIGERQLKPKRSHFYASEVGNDDNRADIIFCCRTFFTSVEGKRVFEKMS